MTKQELEFLLEHHINFETYRLGYTRNISFDVMEQYEFIYKKYIDSGFILTYWCGSCVFDMLGRLITFCEEDEDYIKAINPQTYKPTKTESEPIKKRGRPRK